MPARLRVNTFKHEYSKTGGTIAITFYLKHHLGSRKAALSFGPDRIRTLVSMTTDSCHRVINGKMVVIGL